MLSGEEVLATGLWTAVSGASAQTATVDTVANNLANSETLGFKKDTPTFKEYMAHAEREKLQADLPKGRITDKDFYPLDGRDQTFVVNDGTYTNFRQGNLRVTNSPMDLAIDGPGFIEVSTPNGIRYTRQGSLKTATDGRLVTTDGYPVLAAQAGGLANALPATTVQPGQGGLETQGRVAAELGYVPGSPADPAVASRFINLRDRGTNISVTEQGDLYAGDQLVAKVGVAEFADPRKLRKSGALMFENPDPGNRLGQSDRSIVRQGVLETSNVNPVEEMTRLIQANRLFEQNLKSVKTYNELIGREVNDIGKL